MKFTLVSETKQRVLLRCEGEINRTHAAPDDPLAELLGESCYGRKVLIDLERTTYIDSSGISWLVSCQKRFRQAGGKLVLHTVPPLVMQVLKLLRMDQVLTLAVDLKAAESAVQGDTP